MLERIVEKANFADLFIVVVTSIALVSFWRGVWGLMDIYLFPENPPLSFAASILIGFVILFLIALYKKDTTKT